jgi:hypothetical protein
MNKDSLNIKYFWDDFMSENRSYENIFLEQKRLLLMWCVYLTAKTLQENCFNLLNTIANVDSSECDRIHRQIFCEGRMLLGTTSVNVNDLMIDEDGNLTNSRPISPRKSTKLTDFFILLNDPEYSFYKEKESGESFAHFVFALTNLVFYDNGKRFSTIERNNIMKFFLPLCDFRRESFEIPNVGMQFNSIADKETCIGINVSSPKRIKICQRPDPNQQVSDQDRLQEIEFLRRQIEIVNKLAFDLESPSRKERYLINTGLFALFFIATIVSLWAFCPKVFLYIKIAMPHLTEAISFGLGIPLTIVACASLVFLFARVFLFKSYQETLWRKMSLQRCDKYQEALYKAIGAHIDDSKDKQNERSEQTRDIIV